MTLNTVFEKEICGRCGGSGRYSWNQMTQDRCFGCNGKGERLTKRGAAAAAFYRELLMVPLSDLKVGDLMECTDFSPTMSRTYFSRITAITMDTESTSSSLKDGVMVPNPPSMRIQCEKSGLVAWPEHRVRKGWDAEFKNAAIEKALAYQATLTKQGKLMKGKAA